MVFLMADKVQNRHQNRCRVGACMCSYFTSWFESNSHLGLSKCISIQWIAAVNNDPLIALSDYCGPYRGGLQNITMGSCSLAI